MPFYSIVVDDLISWNPDINRERWNCRTGYCRTRQWQWV